MWTSDDDGMQTVIRVDEVAAITRDEARLTLHMRGASYPLSLTFKSAEVAAKNCKSIAHAMGARAADGGEL